MNKIKSLIGMSAAALATASMAAPADAQRYGRYDGHSRYYGRDRGIDAGDIFAGVAILGGIAAITSALSRDAGRYGYGYRDRYAFGYQAAVNACGYQAERAGRGRVSVQDVDRVGNDRFRVRGVVQNGAGYGGGYYDRGGYGGYGEAFTCTARGNGRVTNFRLNDYAYGGGYGGGYRY